MRKIRCPRCAVINMEGFTTFPYCAACGTRLPDTHDEHSHVGWRRPLRSALWAAIIGCAVLGLALYATNFFESTPTAADTSSLVLYGRAPRTAPVGEEIQVPIVLDRASVTMGGRNLNYEAITLRLPRDLFDSFELRSLQPSPVKLEKRGNGYYYYYSSLPPDAIIHVTLLPLRTGVLEISAKMFSGSELQGSSNNEFQTFVTVTKKSSQRAAISSPESARK
jgi:hypothetical protein